MTKMAAAHIQTYVLHVTLSILYTCLIINSILYIYTLIILLLLLLIIIIIYIYGFSLNTFF